MICLIQNVEDYNNDLRVILMAFYMGVKIITPENIEKKPELGADITATLVAEFAEDQKNLDEGRRSGCGTGYRDRSGLS